MSFDPKVKIALIIGLFVAGLLLVSIVPMNYAPQGTEYNYNIKVEQVEDSSNVDNATDIDELNESRNSLLYQAFRKSDHLFSSSEVSFKSKNKYNTFSGWEVVNVEGVYLLVAVEEPEKTSYHKSDKRHTMYYTSFFIGFLLIAVGIVLALDVVD